MKNRRLIYLLLIIITIPVGLATRSHGNWFPAVIRVYGGDVLYATLIFFIARFVATRVSVLKIALSAYVFCICIETLQLYQAPWIEKIRHTFPFGLILGYGFLWSDWLCYFFGVLIGLLVAFLVEKGAKGYQAP